MWAVRSPHAAAWVKVFMCAATIMQAPGARSKASAAAKIDARLRLVVAGDFGAEDRVPGQAVAAGEIDHQGYVAVGNRRQQELALEPVRPGATSGHASSRCHARLRWAAVSSEVRRSRISAGCDRDCAMQHVELAEWDAPGADLIHGGLILIAPGIREREPIDVMAERFQHRLGLPRNTRCATP